MNKKQFKSKKAYYNCLYIGKLTSDISDTSGVNLIDRLKFSDISTLVNAKCIVCKDIPAQNSHQFLLLQDLSIPQIYGVDNNVDKLLGKKVTFYSNNGNGFIEEGKANYTVEKNLITSTYVFKSTERGIKYAANQNAQVLMVRGEFLQLSFLKTFPLQTLQENRQLFIENITKVLKLAANNYESIVYRLSDFSKEYFSAFGLPSDSSATINPAMSQRGGYLLLNQHLPVFKAELGAIKKIKNYQDKIRIMIPFVRDIKEIKLIREIITNTLGPKIKIGIMIEVPANLFHAKQIAQYADFFGIGTKDLSQFIGASDRNDQKLQYNNIDIVIKLLIEYFIPNIGEQDIYIPDAEVCKLLGVYNFKNKIISIT